MSARALTARPRGLPGTRAYRLDFFDASINRVAAWVIGAPCSRPLLLALLEPSGTLRKLELQGDFTARLAMLEELKSLPFGAVWDYYCLRADVPAGAAWLENTALRTRSQFRRLTGALCWLPPGNNAMRLCIP